MKTSFRFLGILVILALAVLLGGCPTNGETPTKIGTWATTADIEDMGGNPGADMLAGSTVVIGMGTYSTTYTVDDNGTQYNCTHSGTFTPTDPDSSNTLLIDVLASEDGGSSFAPALDDDIQYIFSNQTATTIDLGVSFGANGVVDLTMPLVKQ